MAEQTAEVAALDSNWAKSLASADTRGCRAVVDAFDDACKTSKAVMNYTCTKLLAQVANSDIFETYYEHARRVTTSENRPLMNWSVLRPQTESELLGSDENKEKLHYAALTLTEQGLQSYGDCSLLLREDLTGHRASCFEANSAVKFATEGGPFPLGSRSTWENRHKLCVAKLEKAITKSTTADQFADVLLSQEPTKTDDNFIEVHVFGPISLSTLENVTLTATLKGEDKLKWKIIKTKLEKAGVKVNE